MFLKRFLRDPVGGYPDPEFLVPPLGAPGASSGQCQRGIVQSFVYHCDPDSGLDNIILWLTKMMNQLEKLKTLNFSLREVKHGTMLSAYRLNAFRFVDSEIHNNF